MGGPEIILNPIHVFSNAGEFKIKNASAAFFVFEPEHYILQLPS